MKSSIKPRERRLSLIGDTNDVVKRLNQMQRLPKTRVFLDRKLGADGERLLAEFTIDDLVVETNIAMFVCVPAVQGFPRNECF